jgi:hypothetical protein
MTSCLLVEFGKVSTETKITGVGHGDSPAHPLNMPLA